MAMKTDGMCMTSTKCRTPATELKIAAKREEMNGERALIYIKAPTLRERLVLLSLSLLINVAVSIDVRATYRSI